jgi:hypothetical protein
MVCMCVWGEGDGKRTLSDLSDAIGFSDLELSLLRDVACFLSRSESVEAFQWFQFVTFDEGVFDNCGGLRVSEIFNIGIWEGQR